MKKIVSSLLLIFILVSFTACKSGNSIIVDTPSDEISVALGLENVKNGVALNADKDINSPYYDVRVNQDLKSSLFYQSINVNSYMINKTESVNLKPLAFNAEFTNPINTTLIELIKILNDESEGISKEDLGVNLLDDDYSDYLVGNLTPTNNVKIPEGLVSSDTDPIKLVVVYMPIYGVFSNGAKNYTNIFLMVPVFYAFTNDSTVTNYTDTVKEYNCQMIEVSQNTYVLPSKTE